MEGFNFESFLDELYERDKHFLDKELPETNKRARERLLKRPPCEPERDFKKFFPKEIHPYFDSPFNGTYYRIAPATAAVQFPQTGIRPMVFLTPRPPHEEGRNLEDDFVAYFGCDPEMLANLVKDKWMTLLWGGPEGFRDEKNPYKELFKRFFYFFREFKLHQDRSYGPFFANSIEESIARGCFQTSWKVLRLKEEARFSGKPFEIVEYAKGLKANPAAFLPERIAWLKLLWGEKAEWFIKPIDFCIKEDNPALACKVAFVFHELFTAPTFYARGCLHSVDYLEDLEGRHLEVVSFLKNYVLNKYPTSMPRDLLGGIGMLLRAYASFRLFTKPEFKESPGHVLVHLVPKEGLKWAMETDELDMLRVSYQTLRAGQAKFGYLGFQRKFGRDVIEKEILPARRKIGECYVKGDVARKIKAMEYSRSPIIITLAAVYMGLKQTTLGFSEFDHALVHLLPEIKESLEHIWYYYKEDVRGTLEKELEKEWQSLDYLPPLCVWRIPEKEARRMAELSVS